MASIISERCFVPFGDVRDVDQIGERSASKKASPAEQSDDFCSTSKYIAVNRAPFKDVGSKSLVYRHRNGVDEVSLEGRANPLNLPIVKDKVTTYGYLQSC